MTFAPCASILLKAISTWVKWSFSVKPSEIPLTDSMSIGFSEKSTFTSVFVSLRAFEIALNPSALISQSLKISSVNFEVCKNVAKSLAPSSPILFSITTTLINALFVERDLTIGSTPFPETSVW